MGDPTVRATTGPILVPTSNPSASTAAVTPSTSAPPAPALVTIPTGTPTPQGDTMSVPASSSTLATAAGNLPPALPFSSAPAADPVANAQALQARANALVAYTPDQEKLADNLPPDLQQKFKELSADDRAHFLRTYTRLEAQAAQSDWKAGASKGHLEDLLRNGTLGKKDVLANLDRLQQGPAWDGYQRANAQVDPAEQADHVIDELADPKNVFQGANSEFCASASVMTRLALTDPARYTAMAADLVTKGQLTVDKVGPDGKPVTGMGGGPETTTVQVDPNKVWDAEWMSIGRDPMDSVMMSALCQSVGNSGNGEEMLQPAQYEQLYQQFFPGSVTLGPNAIKDRKGYEDAVLDAAKDGPLTMMFYNKDPKTGQPVTTESHTVTVKVEADGQIHVFTNGKDEVWHRGGGDNRDFDKLFGTFFAGGNFPPAFKAKVDGDATAGLAASGGWDKVLSVGAAVLDITGVTAAYHTAGTVVHFIEDHTGGFGKAMKGAENAVKGFFGGIFGHHHHDDGSKTGGSGAGQPSSGGSGAGQPSSGGSGAGSMSTGGSGAGSTSTGGSGAGSTSTGGSGAGTTSTGGSGAGTTSTGGSGAGTTATGGSGKGVESV